MDSIAIPVLVGLVALGGYWVVANVGEFAWNLWRAGDRSAISDRDEQIAALESSLLVAESRIPTATGDEEIVASLMPRTRQVLIASSDDLTRGMSSYQVDPAVIAQLAEYGLVVITNEDTPVFGGQQRRLIPFIRLNADGLRIMRKVKGAKKDPID